MCPFSEMCIEKKRNFLCLMPEKFMRQTPFSFTHCHRLLWLIYTNRKKRYASEQRSFMDLPTGCATRRTSQRQKRAYSVPMKHTCLKKDAEPSLKRRETCFYSM